MARWNSIPEAHSLQINGSTTIIVNGTAVALCRDTQGFYPLSNRCPHQRRQRSATAGLRTNVTAGQIDFSREEVTYSTPS